MDPLASFIVGQLVATDGNTEPLENLIKIVQEEQHNSTVTTQSLLQSLEQTAQEAIQQLHQAAATPEVEMTGGTTTTTSPLETNPYRLFPKGSRRQKRTFSAQ